MKLSFEEIKNIATGWVSAEIVGDGICLTRFTKEQHKLYKTVSDDFYDKSFSSAGIRLRFKTNSENLFIKITPSRGSSRKYFSVDVFSDGKAIGYIDNFENEDMTGAYAKIDLPMEPVSGKFYLGKGKKELCVYLPWSTETVIDEISLDDEAFFEPAKPTNKLLVLGDSITQGYDAIRPSNRYIGRVADMLDAEEINKAIGGEVFRPELAELKDDFNPEYILVSYGSNDWNYKSEPEFKENCKNFFNALVKNYPGAKIFAVSPLWRKEITEYRQFGAFENVEKGIREVTGIYENVTLISGFNFVPHEEKYFADFRLHPNDEGFGFYFNNLITEIKKHI